MKNLSSVFLAIHVFLWRREHRRKKKKDFVVFVMETTLFSGDTRRRVRRESLSKVPIQRKKVHPHSFPFSFPLAQILQAKSSDLSQTKNLSSFQQKKEAQL
jgi:hypothetical protein